MSEVREAVKKLARDAYLETALSQRKNRIGVVSEVNADGTVQVSIDGSLVTATLLYPAIKGQQVVVVPTQGNLLSAAPLVPNPAPATFQQSPFFTGILRKFRMAYSAWAKSAIRFQDSGKTIVYHFDTDPLISPHHVALSPNGKYVAAHWPNDTAKTHTIKVYLTGTDFTTTDWVDEPSEIMGVTLTLVSSMTYNYEEAPDGDGGVYVRTILDIAVDDTGLVYGLETKVYKVDITKNESGSYTETNRIVAAAKAGWPAPSGPWLWLVMGDFHYTWTTRPILYRKGAVSIVGLTGSRTEIAKQEWTKKKFATSTVIAYTVRTKFAYGFNGALTPWSHYYPVIGGVQYAYYTEFFVDDELLGTVNWPTTVWMHYTTGGADQEGPPGFGPSGPEFDTSSGYPMWGTSSFDPPNSKIVGFDEGFTELGVIEIPSGPVAFNPGELEGASSYHRDGSGLISESALLPALGGRSFGFQHDDLWKFFETENGTPVILYLTNSVGSIGEWAVLLVDLDGSTVKYYVVACVISSYSGYSIKKCTKSGSAVTATDLVKIAGGQTIFRPGSKDPYQEQPEGDNVISPRFAYMPKPT